MVAHLFGPVTKFLISKYSRRDLSRAVKLLEMVKRREKMKKDDLQLNIEIYEKRYQAKDFSGQLMSEYTAVATKSRYEFKFKSQFDNKLSQKLFVLCRPAFAPLYSNQYYNHHLSSNSISQNNQWNNSSSQNYANMHLNHHHLQNKRDFDGMSTSSSRKEKRQYKKRKHKTQREIIKQGMCVRRDINHKVTSSKQHKSHIYIFLLQQMFLFFSPFLLSSSSFGFIIRIIRRNVFFR